MNHRERVRLALNAYRWPQPDLIEIQAFVPPENIVTMFDTALRYGRDCSTKTAKVHEDSLV